MFSGVIEVGSEQRSQLSERRVLAQFDLKPLVSAYGFLDHQHNGNCGFQHFGNGGIASHFLQAVSLDSSEVAVLRCLVGALLAGVEIVA